MVENNVEKISGKPWKLLSDYKCELAQNWNLQVQKFETATPSDGPRDGAPRGQELDEISAAIAGQPQAGSTLMK